VRPRLDALLMEMQSVRQVLDETPHATVLAFTGPVNEAEAAN
jgi:hypothetical protein